eukprot:351166-Chlamydomonas_euryale.AAC.2
MPTACMQKDAADRQMCKHHGIGALAPHERCREKLTPAVEDWTGVLGGSMSAVQVRYTGGTSAAHLLLWQRLIHLAVGRRPRRLELSEEHTVRRKSAVRQEQALQSAGVQAPNK